MLVSVELALVVLALFVGPGASKWAEGTNRVYVRKGGGSCDGRASDCTLWTSATQMKGDMERMVSQAAKEQEENYAAVKRVRPDFAVRVRLGSMRCISGGGGRVERSGCRTESWIVGCGRFTHHTVVRGGPSRRRPEGWEAGVPCWKSHGLIQQHLEWFGKSSWG